MVAKTLDVEPVADAGTPSKPIDSVGRTHAATIYQVQLGFMAARVAALEDQLEQEQANRQRMIERYEHLLAQRDAEIRRLQEETDRGLLARIRERVD